VPLDPYLQAYQPYLQAGMPPLGTANVNLGGGTATSSTQQIPRAQQARKAAQQFADNSLANVQKLLGGLGGIPTGRLGLGAAVVPGVMAAGTELQEGRPVGALGAIGSAGLGGIAGAGVARFISTGGRFGFLGKAAQLALPALGAAAAAPLGAQAAEYGRMKATNVPTKGKEGDFENQLAAQKALSELGLSQFRTQTGIETGAVKDLSKFYSDQAYLDLQRNMPLVNQMKNADLVRQQALLASQGNQLARLSVLGTAGQLAQGAQAETGATVRTMITSNPYANAVLR
jgi:hypothetical protein